MTRNKNDNSKELSSNSELTINTEHPHSSIYAGIEHYKVNKNGCLFYSNGEKFYLLANGSIVITKEIYKFNGNGESEIEFQVEGITRNGIKLPPVTVPASKFNSLNWITESWGTSLVVMPNQSVKQTLATGVLMSGEQCERERVCTHTGYIIKNGKPINYMSANGSLIPSEIKCVLDHDLKRYKLSEPSASDTERIDGITASLNLLEAHAPEVTGPLFAFTYLAPILPIVNDMIGDTSFFMFLQGKTQSGKSTLAALSMSHYGIFDSQTPPTTFASTSNAIGEMAFILKDSVLWIDDYHPQADDMKRQNQIFQDLVRMSGDHSTRRRLDSKAKLKESRPPRCLFLVTGEFPPKIGQSGHARVFQLDVPESRKDISKIRKDARTGTLSRAMTDYIAYVISNFDRLKELAQMQHEKILSNLYTDEGYIITQFNGSPVHASTIRKWIKKAFEFCEVPYVTVHGLRHTYASLLIANGVDVRTTASQLGHSSPSLTLNTYANPQNEAKRRAGDLIGTIARGTN